MKIWKEIGDSIECLKVSKLGGGGWTLFSPAWVSQRHHTNFIRWIDDGRVACCSVLAFRMKLLGVSKTLTESLVIRGGISSTSNKSFDFLFCFLCWRLCFWRWWRRRLLFPPFFVQQGWAVNENRVRGKEEEYIAANQQKRTRHRFLYSYLPWEPTRVRSIILCIHVLFFLFFFVLSYSRC